MKETFADTFYYLAVLHKDDAAHERAMELSGRLTGPTITTAWVLSELADGLAAPATRGGFGRLLASLRADPRCTILPASQDLFQRGVDLSSGGRKRRLTLRLMKRIIRAFKDGSCGGLSRCGLR